MLCATVTAVATAAKGRNDSQVKEGENAKKEEEEEEEDVQEAIFIYHIKAKVSNHYNKAASSTDFDTHHLAIRY